MKHRPADVSAVVCTMNSGPSIEACLRSLRAAGVGQVIVVDAHSTDGTYEIAMDLADMVMRDEGAGLARARNIGIAQTSGSLVLNMGSDNVITASNLSRMIDTLESLGVQGVSARTRVIGNGYVARAMDAWRSSRFRPGPSRIIGTPTLFIGDLLRAHPFNPMTTVSDDSELCERWATDLGSTFAISDAYIEEFGKASMRETWIRCRMYGSSDAEIYRHGLSQGWSLRRRWQSILHPFSADLVGPIRVLSARDRVRYGPYLVAFTAMRYAGWIRACLKRR